MKGLFHRLLALVPVLIGVGTMTFLIIHLVPGDPTDLILGDQASVIEKQQLKTQLGLDKPLLSQFGNFWANTLSGDLGQSVYSRKPVAQLIASRIPATLELTFGAMLMALLIGIPIGVISSIKPFGKIDLVSSVGSILGISLPGIFLGPLLIYFFSIRLEIFPVSGRGGLNYLFLPALSLAIPLSAILIRMTRASMLEVIKEDFIKVARSKGLAKRTIFFKHALRNALIPVITIVGLQVGTLLTGTVITETIFDWPGLGTLLIDGIKQRDYPIVQGCILLIAVIYVGVNFITDILYQLADPKMRAS